MEIPEIRYVTTTDGVRIAYQRFGAGPSVVLFQDVVSHVEMNWEHELFRRVFDHYGSHLDLTIYDSRGTGLSERFDTLPDFEQRLLDVEAVMAAEGLERPSMIGLGTGGTIAATFANRYPDRLERLVLVNAPAGLGNQDRANELFPEPYVPLEEMAETRRAIFEEMVDDWGVDSSFWMSASTPSILEDREFERWISRWARMSATKEVARRQIESLSAFDISVEKGGIAVPTLVQHTSRHRFMSPGNAFVWAEHIPGATVSLVDSDDSSWWPSPTWRVYIDEQIAFITGEEIEAPATREFAVVLLTDLVGSTEAANAAGDDEWKVKLDAHDRIARTAAEGNGGVLVKGTGDGILARFRRPSDAIVAAKELRSRLGDLGLAMRAGIAAGEIEVRGDDISGAVVNLAARVEQAAPNGEIMVTTAVRDLLIGSRFAFGEATSHQPKGFDVPWRLCVVR